ncbi:hypothetical protein [Streptomyces sp. NPDC050504]|uniref:hypothetical protein n=1 Tax=Streptomyces sp. NPDC050504 TaxID=3365618 RepID=UPI0037A0B369
MTEMEESESPESTPNDALDKLRDAIGQPPSSVAENAKALFPFIAHEALMSEALVNSESTSADVEEDAGEPESAGCHRAAPGR